MEDIRTYMHNMGQAARAASRLIAKTDTATKNIALNAIADNILHQEKSLLEANADDLALARQQGLNDALLDRLTLKPSSILGMAEGLRQIAALNDPIGEISDLQYRPSGIQVGRMRVPLGVIGIIYEARPNVTIDAAGLCIKSGNAVILRGGSEALHCNQALAALVHQGLVEAGLSTDIVQVVNTADRAAVGELITMKSFVDVIVPRGGKSLIERITREATIPVIKHLDGNCHIYVDSSANIAQALDIIDNAKTQRLGTCNTAESLLIAADIAPMVLPRIADRLTRKNVQLRVCRESLTWIPAAQLATEEDYYTEYLDAIISIKIVPDLDAAITHINQYSSQHTEAIITENYSHALRFVREVDSSSVMVNASTRFADGFEYGLGAEIGISTDKLHARGPVGLEGLTSLKYVVFGHGEVRR